MLEFDSWQRCETVKHLLNWSLGEEKATLLDVGGYPGRMRAMMPQHDWILCDPLVDAPGDQLRGGAEALPFKDDSFDLCVALDVLEHIPEEKRPHVLQEMTRVSKYGLLLSFPYQNPLVEAAESHVREVYSHLNDGKEHPWLAEHALYPLPDLVQILEQLQSFGGETGVFDVGGVLRWMKLQFFDMLLEETPGTLDLAKELDRFYQDKIFPYEFKSTSYRKIILHLLHAQEPIPLELIQPPIEEEIPVEMEFQREIMMGLTDIIIPSLSQVIQKVKDTRIESPPIKAEEKIIPEEPFRKDD